MPAYKIQPPGQSGAQYLWTPAKGFCYSGNIRSCMEAQYSEEDCLHEFQTLKPQLPVQLEVFVCRNNVSFDCGEAWNVKQSSVSFCKQIFMEIM